MRESDTRYQNHPWEPGPSGTYVAPFGSAEYVQTQDALDSVTAMHYEVAERPVPLRQINPFPPRLGYRQTAPGIREILSTARLYPDQSRTLSGTEAGYTGSPRNIHGNLYG